MNDVENLRIEKRGLEELGEIVKLEAAAMEECASSLGGITEAFHARVAEITARRLSKAKKEAAIDAALEQKVTEYAKVIAEIDERKSRMQLLFGIFDRASERLREKIRQLR